MSSLAHKLGLDNSTLTRNIQKLEKMDLVERNSDNYDKRVQRVLLSKKGSSLLASLEKFLEQQNDKILNHIIATRLVSGNSSLNTTVVKQLFLTVKIVSSYSTLTCFMRPIRLSLNRDTKIAG